jgi:bacteriorhodopsin
VACLSGFLIAATVQWLIFHDLASGVMTTILGLGLSTTRSPSRWFYVLSGTALVAALVLAPFNHRYSVNEIGSLLLAVACSGLVVTFAARFWHGRDEDETHEHGR